MITESQKIERKLYMREWRKKNKEKNRLSNYKYQQKYIKNNTTKFNFRKQKYFKYKFHCLFCNKKHLLCNKKRHNNSSKHKKNVIKFNTLLTNI